MLTGCIVLFSPQKLTSRFQFAFARVFRWPLALGRNISLSTRTVRSPGESLERSKYDQLKNYVATVEMQLARERQRYKELSGFRKRTPLDNARFAQAYIVKATLDELVIDCGLADGLAKGQFVLGKNSVVGAVSEVSSRTARVKLIGSATSQIPVLVAGQPGVIQGDGSGQVKIPLLGKKYKIQVGDNVFAAPRPGFLNAPILIGTVCRCKTNTEDPLLWDITVEPACEIERLSSVDVIIMNPQK
jgi:rod shape-determining protein MreC